MDTDCPTRTIAADQLADYQQMLAGRSARFAALEDLIVQRPRAVAEAEAIASSTTEQ
ncbi:MAG TPA: hypothetical protein VF157_09760 [Chloroflexota bacterium]